jgi:hypothetical protein
MVSLSKLATFGFFMLYSMVSADISYTRDYRVPIDICIDNSGPASINSNYSFIYRCSEDSVWKFTYTECSDCNCTLNTATMLGGCTSGGSMYRTYNCSQAQTNASKNSNCSYVATGSSQSAANADSIGPCINYELNNYNSYRYECSTSNNSLFYFRYRETDCQGLPDDIDEYDKSDTSYNYRCGDDCSAHVFAYDNNEVCNYEDSEYKSADPNDECNYIIFSDGAEPNAIDVCYSFRQAYYEYSRKLVCSSDKSKVYLKQWMQSDSCDDGESDVYIISEYDVDNYTVNCNGRTCDGKYRTYDDCDYHYQYSESPIVWNLCQKTYQDHQESDYNASYNDYLYQMTTCLNGAKATFYFTDSNCEKYDTFLMENYSSSGCQYELTGCENTNDILSSSIMFNCNVYYLVVLAIFAVIFY